MNNIYEVQLNDGTFYMVEKEGNNGIHLLWKTLKDAELDHGSAYAIVMPQHEVISYGRTLGYIKNPKLIKKGIMI